MSRSVAAVIAITLGFPILAMIALAANGGFNPELLMTFLVGGAVTVFVVGAIFEIKRLADLDHRETATGSELQPPAETPRQASTSELPKPHLQATPDSRNRTVRSDPVQPINLAKPRVYEAPAAARAALDGSTRNDEVLVAAQPVAESTTADEVASELIVVTPQQSRSKPAAKAKPATRKRKDSGSSSEASPPKKPTAVKGSRKSEPRKPGNP
jgi:hypothetical protein